MSVRTDQFEQNMAKAIYKIFKSDKNFQSIPAWFTNEYGTPPYNLSNVIVTGSKLGKTDISVEFQHIKKQLNISVKMGNADYWGNWYSHTRFVDEFGLNSFNKIVSDCTKWANDWMYNSNASLFIGVSVSFGKRTGNTARNLGDILSADDVISIVKGNFDNHSLNANSIYISNNIPNNFIELFSYLNPITHDIIESSGILQDMKIVYRPINPLKEKSNRGKCIYTKYQPYDKFTNNITISSVKELQKYGEFYPVTNNSLNHNRQIKKLSQDYNITIPVKN